MQYLSVLVLLSLLSTAIALRCKCTKESETVTCNEGTCYTDGGSCLMLDHPKMGIHYTCHTRALKDGSCHNRTSKSGVEVKICGCNGPDFCNYAMWPDKPAKASQQVQRPTENDKVNSAIDISFIGSTIFTFISLFLTL